MLSSKTGIEYKWFIAIFLLFLFSEEKLQREQQVTFNRPLQITGLKVTKWVVPLWYIFLPTTLYSYLPHHNAYHNYPHIPPHIMIWENAFSSHNTKIRILSNTCICRVLLISQLFPFRSEDPYCVHRYDKVT